MRVWGRPAPSRSPEYQAYVRSVAWQRVRGLALRRAGFRCEHRRLWRCRVRRGLEVHHRHYRDLGCEWDGVRTHGESLRVLCRRHHARADARRRRRTGVVRQGSRRPLGRVWPKFAAGLVGLYFVAHGSALIGMVLIAVAGFGLYRRVA